MLLLVSSLKDAASINIRDNLLDLVDFQEVDTTFRGHSLRYSPEIDAYLITIDQDLVLADFLDELPEEYDRLLFLSKHSSQSKRPSLLVHFPGNWHDDTSLGGKPRTLSYADPVLHRLLVDNLYSFKQEGRIPTGYEVGIEVTHHGPTINRACTFIEIGSTIEYWRDPRAGVVVAEAIINALKDLPNFDSEVKEAKVGIGGPHYAPKFFSKFIEDRSIFLGHIAPKYVADYIDDAIIKQALEKSRIPIAEVLIDWKGLKSIQRKKVVGFLEGIGIPYTRI